MTEHIEAFLRSGEPPTIVRSIAELAANAMSYDEWAISHRIQDALLRNLGLMGEDISRDSAYVHFRNGILTLDYPLDRYNHRRLVLGEDNRATFLDYDAKAEYGRRITASAHFAMTDEERNFECILVQAKNFAVTAQLQLW